jgi:sortase A
MPMVRDLLLFQSRFLEDVMRHFAERFAWSAGVRGLAIWVLADASSRAGARYELNRFEALQAALRLPEGTPDLRLWSPERIQAWQDTLKQAPVPLAVLRIKRLGVEAPVLDGTDDWALNRGVGHIDETAKLGTEGNCGIAGHRDGFFRALKDIGPGDAIEIETLQRVEVYQVERTWMVEPEDVSVLDPTPMQSLTLVTCYPFYFVGSAPQRFIVRAVRARSAPARS